MQNLNRDGEDPSEYWRAVVEAASLGVWDYDTVTGEKHYSARWREIRQLQPSDPLPDTDEDWLATVHPDDVATARYFTEMINLGRADNVSFEYRERGKGGQWLWIMCRGRALRHDATGRAIRFVGIDTDITEMKSAEAARAVYAKQLEVAVTMAGIGIWKFDFHNETVVWDAQLRQIYGVPEQLEPLPRDVWERSIHPEDLDHVLRKTKEGETSLNDYSLDYRIIRADGQVRHIRSRIGHVPDGVDGPSLIGVNWDVTDDLTQSLRLVEANQVAELRLKQLTEAQTELHRISREDHLTGLPNRRAMDEYLAELGPKGTLAAGRAFMLIDIDQFKAVNDTHGHAFGDRMLREISAVLRREIGNAGFLARAGGDEFLAVLHAGATADAAMKIAARAIEGVRLATAAQGREMSISVGVEVGPDPMLSPAELFDRADKAMYRAKLAGGARATQL